MTVKSSGDMKISSITKTPVPLGALPARRRGREMSCGVISTAFISLNLDERSRSMGHNGEAQYSKRTKMLR